MSLKFNNPVDVDAMATIDDTQTPDVIEPNAGDSAEAVTTDSVDTAPKEEPTDNNSDTNPDDTPYDGADSGSEFEAHIPAVAQYLADKGLLTHIPEDVKLDEFDLSEYERTMKFNQAELRKEAFNEGATAAQSNMVDRLSPLSQKLVSFNLDNPNASDDEIRSLANNIIQGDSLTKLTPENNAEEIVREYYKDAGWAPDEIDSKVDRLISTDSLTSEATVIKPKLDLVATKIATQQAAEAKAIKDYETNLLTDLQSKTVGQLKTGKLNNVPLDQETARFLYSAVMNSETPVDLGNRKVHMGYAEALMRQQKYEGNIENVMLSLLVLRDGADSIKKYFASEARTVEATKVYKEQKFSNSKRKVSKQPAVEQTTTGFKFSIK